jgi:hypothetical protein
MWCLAKTSFRETFHLCKLYFTKSTSFYFFKNKSIELNFLIFFSRNNIQELSLLFNLCDVDLSFKRFFKRFNHQFVATLNGWINYIYFEAKIQQW